MQMELPRSLLILMGLAPLAVLFGFLCGRDRAHLWRRFILYSIWALACGCLAVFWASFAPPVYDVYMRVVAKVLGSFGAADLTSTLKSTIESEGGWSSGISGCWLGFGGSRGAIGAITRRKVEMRWKGGKEGRP